MILGNATSKDVALEIALPLARELGCVFIIKWPSQHWTVEDRKPCIRGEEVIEVSKNGKQYCA